MSIEDNIRIRELVSDLLGLVSPDDMKNRRFYAEMRTQLNIAESHNIPMAQAAKAAAVQDAREIGRLRVGFGRFADDRVDDVPIDYLEWLADESAATAKRLRTYLESNHVQAERRD